MSTGEHSASSTSNQIDDLESIKGIGPGFARALKKIGVHHFDDLAQYTPEELAAALLQQAGIKVPAERIEAKDWIGQARELAQQTAGAPLSLEQREVGEEAEPAEAASEPVWRQHAGFSLFFDYAMDESGRQSWQTRVYHEESGDETVLPGVNTADWVNLVLQQAQLPSMDEPASVATVPAPTEKGETPAKPVKPHKANVEIVDVQVEEMEPLSGSIGNRMMVAVHFQLSGPGATDLIADNTPFQVEIQLTDLEKGNVHFTESKRNQLQPEVLEYTSRQELPLPEPGRYEVHSLITLFSPEELKAEYEGPIVNVIA